MTEFNPDSVLSDDADNTNETLGALRQRLLIRLGYAAQVQSPPPGMAELLNDFLISGQRTLYTRYRALRTERFFSWTMVPGERFYTLPDNNESSVAVLNPYKLSWVGVEDLNGAWYDLVSGIPPEFYTAVEQPGLPARYEIRQAIEVFPSPDQKYTLWVKGHFGLTAFTDDEDKSTIDSELLFLWALANAKAHYGQPDANNIAAQANTYRGDLIAGSHGTKRYVPGTRPALPSRRPQLISFDGGGE